MHDSYGNVCRVTDGLPKSKAETAGSGRYMAAIELEGVTKRYGDVTAVRDLDLTVEEGEVFGFLGPNGAGKSTTINMLLDFVRPTSGSVRVLSRDAQAESVAVRRRTGVLPEGYDVYERLTGRQHVEFAMRSKELDGDVDAAFDGGFEFFGEDALRVGVDIVAVDKRDANVLEQAVKQFPLDVGQRRLDDLIQVLVAVRVVVDRGEGEGGVQPVAFDLVVAVQAVELDQRPVAAGVVVCRRNR